MNSRLLMVLVALAVFVACVQCFPTEVEHVDNAQAVSPDNQMVRDKRWWGLGLGRWGLGYGYGLGLGYGGYYGLGYGGWPYYGGYYGYYGK